MVIRVKVTAKNDHCSLTEGFEADHLTLSLEDEQLKGWVEKVLEAFNQPVETLTVKAWVDL